MPKIDSCPVALAIVFNETMMPFASDVPRWG